MSRASFFAAAGFYSLTVVALPFRRASGNMLLYLNLVVVWGVLFVGASFVSDDLARSLRTSATLIVILLAIVTAGIRNWTTWNSTQLDLRAILVPTWLFVVSGLVLGVLDGSLSGDVNVARFAGASTNPNGFAMASAMGLFIALSISVDSSRPKKLLAVSPFVVALLISASLTSIVAALAGLGVIAVGAALRGKTRQILKILAVCGCALGAAFLFQQARLQLVVDRFASSDLDRVSGRDEIWSVAWDMITMNPFGVGSGMVDRETAERYEAGASSFEGMSLHSTYLSAGATAGWFALAVYLILVSFAIWSALQSLRSTEASYLGGAVIAGAVIQLTESAGISYSAPFFYLFWFTATAIVAESSREKPSLSTKSPFSAVTNS